MSRSLLGGGAVGTAVALLSASLIFSAETSVAEPLAFATVVTTSNRPSGSPDAGATEAEEPAAKADSTGVKGPEAESSLEKSGKRGGDASAEAVQAQSFVATAYSLRGRKIGRAHV